MAAVTRDLPALDIVVAGEHARSSSTIAASGAYVVVVTTTVAALAYTLTSVYLGAIAGDTLASHLRLGPRRSPALSHRLLAGAQSGATHARVAMLDHVAELQDALGELTREPVSIDIGAEVLEVADATWRDAADSTGA